MIAPHSFIDKTYRKGKKHTILFINPFISFFFLLCRYYPRGSFSE